MAFYHHTGRKRYRWGKTIKLRNGLIKIGKNTLIYPNVYFEVSNNAVLTIGDNCKIFPNVFFDLHEENTQANISSNCEIRKNTQIEVVGGKLEIASGVVLGINNWIQGSGNVTLGENTILGSNVSVISTSHKWDDSSISVKEQDVERKEVNIGSNTWIGSGTSVLYGVNIGNNTIIGAHSLCNQNIPDNTMVYGSPAREVKSI